MEPTANALPNVSVFLKQACSFYKKNWKSLASIGLVIPVVYLLELLVYSVLFYTLALSLPAVFIVVSILFGIINLVVFSLTAIIFVQAIKNLDSVNPTWSAKSLFQDYKNNLKMFWSFIWLVLLIEFSCIGAGVFLLVPAIALALFVGFWMYAFVLDGKKGISALSTSFYYVQGNWWKIFWRDIVISILAILVLAIAGLLVALVFHLFGIPFPEMVSHVGHSFYVSTQPFQGNGLANAIMSIIIYFLSFCVFWPFVMFFNYSIYKHLKSLKPEPNPEVDFKSTRGLFKGLAFFGLIILVCAFAAGIFLTYKQSHLFSTSDSKPLTASDPTVLSVQPYVSPDLGISIVIPKGWKETYDAQQGLVMGDPSKPLSPIIEIQKVSLTPTALKLPVETLMAEIAQGVFQNRAGAKNISFKKVIIGSATAYEASGQVISSAATGNLQFYFILDGSSVYAISTSWVESQGQQAADMILDSVSTFKIIQ